MNSCFIQSMLYQFQLCYLLSLGALVPSFTEALEVKVYLYLKQHFTLWNPVLITVWLFFLLEDGILSKTSDFLQKLFCEA